MKLTGDEERIQPAPAPSYLLEAIEAYKRNPCDATRAVFGQAGFAARVGLRTEDLYLVPELMQRVEAGETTFSELRRLAELVREGVPFEWAEVW